MAQRDWEDVYHKIVSANKNFLASLIENAFFPSEQHTNPFDAYSINISAVQLNKDKPGQWIPIYKKEDLPKFYIDNHIMPVRAGPAEFFFYHGDVFYDASTCRFVEIDTQKILPIESFVV